ncbi:MAG: amidase [Chloroflexi bacterium]|jgi:Asp-tRNA(Asn)/Glu-tRNA(Gln) amidotransferase A subunit family amidase|nr:amidase [Chloroflexota bacterium]MBT4001888.1 amidase [Chloroflexota bacterium]MBT4305620.1 amidase [Chloroflexota bacterium]MBT4535028.1 amidase [Chloroflexota bacterium]MBT4683980.1 amidase [Chloroflexota bacterium]
MNLFESIDKLEIQFKDVEPKVMAFLPEENRFNRLRQEAKELDLKFPNPESRLPLFGEFIGVKDIFHVDGFSTQAGSKLPSEILSGKEAKSVSKLKEKGALIVGKTVTTEFAYFAPGPTRNPYDYAHTPGGSSSGSAAAVSAELCSLALGTQTIGSVIRPAAFCGVVGYKPSYDLISREGVIPLSPSLDHVGIFTKNTKILKKAAGVFLGPQKTSPKHSKDIIMGVPVGPYMEHVSEIGRTNFEETCDLLQNSGIIVKKIPAMDDFQAIYDRHNLIVAAEAAIVHKDWFQQYKDRYHLKTTELIQQGSTISEESLKKALLGRRKLRDELMKLMALNGIDFWLSPAAPGPAPKGLESTGDPVMNLPWTHAGLPTINLPSGNSNKGLPLGLQITGGWYMDKNLIEASQKIEMILPGKVH